MTTATQEQEIIPVNRNHRRGDWCQTFTGIKFWPLDPIQEEVDIRDIAHALSMQCRYAGHVREFYSVAQHCVHVSDVVQRDLKPWGLMHDSAEAYLTDIPRPVKVHLRNFRLFEDRLLAVIAGRFGLTGVIPEGVKAIDMLIMKNEKRDVLMQNGTCAWDVDLIEEFLPVVIQPWSPARAEMEFMKRFNCLFPEHAIV